MKRELDGIIVPTARPVMKPKRKCGSCTACCYTEPVLAMKKPGFSKCKHDTGRSCAIHSMRPVSCRRFECLWLHGVGDDSDRPDKIGVVFAGGHMHEPDLRIYAYEAKPGASDQGRGALIRNNFIRSGCDVRKRTATVASMLWILKEQMDQATA